MDHRGMRTDPEEITVRLDDGGSPIAGDVQVDGCPRTRFTGWIGLLALLERAIERPARVRLASRVTTTQPRQRK